MTSAFQQYLRKFIEIFLDNFCICSSKDKHIECLTKCFEQCKEYGISLNAIEFVFGVPQRQLVGHIVSKKGIDVDLD